MDQLTTLEKSRLVECEIVINKSMKTFYDMGTALKEIRDSKLYKQGFETFEDYCDVKWNFNSSRARQLIMSTDVLDNLESVTIVTIPQSESQVRPLTKLKDPEIQKQAWAEVVKESEESHEPITAKKVEEVVKRYCEPCADAMEFRIVSYLTPFYHKKFIDKLRGGKESDYIREVLIKHLDSDAA